MPYFGAITITFSISLDVTIGGGIEGSSTFVPISMKNFSIPAGVAQHSMVAELELVFLKLWSCPAGECKNIPGVAMTVRLPDHR